MWSADAILDAIHAAIVRREDELRDEQAVYGLDALDEVGIHPVLVAGVAASGLGVLREQPYPHEWRTRRARRSPPPEGEAGADLPLPRDRLRCDLVLTPEPGQVLADPVVSEQAAAGVRRQGAGTLFESVAEAAAVTETVARPARSIPPEEAFWLEVKLVSQFTFSTGIPGPNRTYASELIRGTTSDIAKLASDERIHHVGLLLVLFTADEMTAEHDLTALMHHLLDKQLPIESPRKRSIEISDRIGNRLCTACLIGVRP